MRTHAIWGRPAVLGAVIAGMLLGTAAPAAAALTTPACLAKKLKEWGKLRKCQATENGKALQGKPADPGKCQTKFDDKLAAIGAQATAAAIACRYGVNADGTATDYDTGLVWEQKTDDGSVHDKDNTYAWSATIGGTAPDGTAFTAFLGTLNNGTSSDASTTSGCFAGHCDWRLPAIEELVAIVDLAAPGCSAAGTSPCIDQTVFGPTAANSYWSATSSIGPSLAWHVFFNVLGVVADTDKANDDSVRAVRSGL